MDEERWQEDEEVVPPPVEPQPTPPTMISLRQFCNSVSGRVAVETLSLFYELELEEDHHWATFEEFQQRLDDLKKRPL